MKQHTSPVPPPPAPPDQSPWTPAKQRIFLTALLETGCVTQAARAAGMSQSSAHRLRQRLTGTPFDRAWELSLVAYEKRLLDPLLWERARGRAPSAASVARP